MSTPQNDTGRWAVCPINFDDPRGPRYFNGEDDALAFFTEQRVNGKAPEWLLPIPVVSRVKSHKGTPVSARLNETSLPVSLGAAPLFTLAERPPERSDDGSRGEPSLIHRSVTLEEILRSPAEQIPGIFETVSIERAGRELSGTLEDELALAQGCATCCLNEDWRHSEIETSARQLPGNDLRRQRGSIREYIVIAMRDYDTARAKIWPHSSNSEMADFWRSWQAHRHLICFGARLAKCDVATALAGSAEAARDAVNEAVNCVSLELARYANGLEAEALATVAVRQEPQNISRASKKTSATSRQQLEGPLSASPGDGEVFNPWRGSCGFYPPAIINRQPTHWITAGQKQLYDRLVGHAGRDGQCFPSQEKLAEELGKTDRQVRTDLDKLEELKLIRRYKGKKRRSNTYVFLRHEVFPLEPASPSHQNTTPEAEAVNGTLVPNNDRGDRNHSSGPERKCTSGQCGTPVPPNHIQETYSEESSSSSSPHSGQINSVKGEEDESSVQNEKPKPTSGELTEFGRVLNAILNESLGREMPAPRLGLLGEILAKAPGWSVAEVLHALKINFAERPGRPKSYRWFVTVVGDIYRRCDGVAPCEPSETRPDAPEPSPKPLRQDEPDFETDEEKQEYIKLLEHKAKLGFIPTEDVERARHRMGMA